MEKDDHVCSKSPICGRCNQPKNFHRLSDGVFIYPCEKCGSGGVCITVRAWKKMRSIDTYKKQLREAKERTATHEHH